MSGGNIEKFVASYYRISFSVIIDPALRKIMPRLVQNCNEFYCTQDISKKKFDFSDENRRVERISWFEQRKLNGLLDHILLFAYKVQ